MVALQRALGAACELVEVAAMTKNLSFVDGQLAFMEEHAPQVAGMMLMVWLLEWLVSPPPVLYAFTALAAFLFALCVGVPRAIREVLRGKGR